MDLAFWRNLAAIWLALLCFIGLLIPLVAAFFAVKGMHFLVDHTPRLLHKAQGYSGMARRQLESASQHAAEPVIRAQSAASRWQTRLTRLLRARRAEPMQREYRL